MKQLKYIGQTEHSNSCIQPRVHVSTVVYKITDPKMFLLHHIRIKHGNKYIWYLEAWY